ncbi:hypothetical protein ACIOGT_36210 [Streptomyces microflavus]|uniref:hypothetical protein n=1 Tax=Streptomyces microflavus TaxID=1919 RepID=UPI003803B9F8
MEAELKLNSLAEAVSLADGHDGLRIDVMLLAGGRQISGRLISEVRYRQTTASTVRAGNAAGAAPMFDKITELVEQRRAENERRNRVGPPHSAPPATPTYAHLLEASSEGHPRTWCFPIAAVSAWAIEAYGFDPAPPEPAAE